MSNWIARGLRRGIRTTRYPLQEDRMPDGYRGRVTVREHADPTALERGAEACLSRAIERRGALTFVKAQRCFQCGQCARVAASAFSMTNDFELAEAILGVDDSRDRLRSLTAAFGRSIHLRHVDCGSDASTEQELQAIFNPFYDVNRLGIFMTATPRHADILIASGVVTHPMVDPLRRAYDAIPEPKVVVALGSAACSGTIYAADAVAGPVDRFIPVDVKVPGTPPSPLTIIHGLWVALGRVAAHAGSVPA